MKKSIGFLKYALKMVLVKGEWFDLYFQAPFTVEKKYWRTDPYDNQLGEIETAERGLMYEEFERRKEALMCEEIEEN